MPSGFPTRSDTNQLQHTMDRGIILDLDSSLEGLYILECEKKEVVQHATCSIFSDAALVTLFRIQGSLCPI